MQSYFFSFSSKRQYILALGDIICLTFAVLAGFTIRLSMIKRDIDLLDPQTINYSIFIILVHIFSLYILGQYELDALSDKLKSTIYLLLSIVISSAVISGILFFFPKYVIGRTVLVIHIFFATLLLSLWRNAFTNWILNKSTAKRLAVIGSGDIISLFIEELSRLKNTGLKLSFLHVPNAGETIHRTCEECDFELVGSINDLLYKKDFDAVAFDATAKFLNKEQIRHIIECKYRGKAVYDLPLLYQNITGKVLLTLIDGRWLLSNTRFHGEQNIFYTKTKRLLDIIFSLILCLLSFPFIILISILIKLDSKGPVLFVQERLGHRKNPFPCYKFRTMVDNAEQLSGPVWSSQADPRITRIGKFLRKTRLDELPQLWNIFRGDISFVGPRPIRAHFAQKLVDFIPFYDLRFSVKPGLSGWAQVNHDYAGSEQGQIEKFQYELFYIQNMSLFLDILVIAKTLRTVIKGSGE